MGSKTIQKNRWKIDNEETVNRERQTERKSDASIILHISGHLNNNNMIDAVIIHLIV